MKIVIIGAGSAFGGRISVDVLSREPLQESTIALCDIHEGRLETVRKYVEKVARSNNLPAEVTASTDRREVLAGADCILIAVAIGGPAYYGHPFEAEMNIPREYGIIQTVADTMGPGGLMRALRSAPPMLDMIDDINELAPDAVVMNYTNPMAILTWALEDRARTHLVGLCHGVTGNFRSMAKLIDIPHQELEFIAAGINHMTWFIKLEHRRKDVLPLALERLFERSKGSDPYEFRGEIIDSFGAYPTESDRHFPEYVPWFQHDDPALFAPHVERTLGIKGKRQHWYEDMGVSIEKADSLELILSHESASGIMEAYVTGSAYRFSGNVMNKGKIIPNLPAECCVEVPCIADGNGIHPYLVDPLPPGCAALCRSNIGYQELAVHAIRERSKELAFQALLMDPITQSKLTIKKARAMFEELWAAEGDLLESYS